MPRKKSKLEDRLIVKKESTWKKMSESERRRVFRYAERYKSFLSKAKTERKAVEEIVSAAEKERYVDLYSAERVKAGSGLLAVNKNKNVDLFVVGKKPIM
ncbi:MAG: aminopeptidase, partial [Thermoplasmata archaeon]